MKLAALLVTTPFRPVMEIKKVTDGVYYGAVPRADCDYRQLQALGIKTLIDGRKFRKRTSSEEASLAPVYGMTYRHIEMGFRPTRDFAPESVLRIAADPAVQPVYFHCKLGRDRAALIAALYRVRFLGWSPDAAYALMRSERFNPFLFDLRRYFWRYTRGAAAPDPGIDHGQ